jgi:hypothetical protein
MRKALLEKMKDLRMMVTSMRLLLPYSLGVGSPGVSPTPCLTV